MDEVARMVVVVEDNTQMEGMNTAEGNITDYVGKMDNVPQEGTSTKVIIRRFKPIAVINNAYVSYDPEAFAGTTTHI